MRDRIHTGLVIAVLLMVGALLGSMLLEWGARSGDGTGADAPTPLSLRGDAPYTAAPISLEVLNGAGDRGAAERFSDRLRDMGFDVKTYGNAESFDQRRTVLLDRSGRDRAARTIADSLGGVPVRVDPAPQLYLDATLLLGSDWREVLARITP